jgi:3-deoxy-D-manno-octulosonic-acid transferase
MTGRPASLRLYALAAGLLAPLAPGILAARARRGREDAARIPERLGRAASPRPAGRLAWLHGASVGEGLSLLPLVARLRRSRPDASVLVTTGTRTSALLMAERLPAGAIHQYAPVDTPGAAARFLDHWRPDLGVFVESELWPNLILGAQARGTRLALVSARLSPGSARGWARAPGAARAVLGAFDPLLARDAAAARVFGDLGLKVDGEADLKLGAEPLPADPAQAAALQRIFAGRSVILAASTHEGEERLIARRFAALGAPDRGAILIIAPRHPDRAGAVAAELETLGLCVARRSLGAAPGAVPVYLADTLGELGLWFRLAHLALIGGSFVPGPGGHNPLEPARLGCPAASGALATNWPIYADMASRGACLVLRDEADLDDALRAVLEEPNAFRALGERGRRFAQASDTAIEATAARLIDLLPR